MSRPTRSRLAVLALCVLAPIAALGALDLAIARSTPFWTWVAQSFPRRVDDSFLSEALIRATAPGRENVLVLGNSRADDGVDLAALETRFAAHGLRFRNATVVGSGLVDAAMRARDLARLEPSTVIAVIAPPEFCDCAWRDETFAYDARAARHIFAWADLWADPEFHFAGLVGELHVLARHRRSFQNAAMVRLGRHSFAEIRLDLTRRAAEARANGEKQVPLKWIRRTEPDVYPNPNTRALAALADTFRAAGARLVVVEAPSHLLLTAPKIAPRVEHFRAYAAELAARHAFTFVPATSFPELELSDFKDLVHVNEAGRARYSQALGDKLESLFAEAGGARELEPVAAAAK